MRTPQTFWYAVKFLTIMLALEYVYELARGTWCERYFVDRLTVASAARWIDFIFHAVRISGANMHVVAQGRNLTFDNTSVNVGAGCEGVEGMFLLLSAVLAFPVSWRKKTFGVLAGLPLMYCLNQVRILALFCALRWRESWFEALHGTVAPSIVILAGGLFFLWWSSDAVQQDARS